MAKSLNSGLIRAGKAKKDEFYTQLVDIEKELKHYKEQFRGKIVYCNCDDPYESNFFKYFAANFNELGLKKLIATSYVDSPIVGMQMPLSELEGLKPSGRQPYKIEIQGVPDHDGDGSVGIIDVELLLKHDKNTATPLRGNGDFRSEECMELLKQVDIVVTNPPFSLFREFVAQLIEYDKMFLIIGSLNAITYKEVFKFLMHNLLWLGYNNGPKKYIVPDSYSQDNIFIGSDGQRYAQMGNTGWFTNLDTPKRHEIQTLYKTYNPLDYPKYDNYEAINVDRVADIPLDYDGVLGVPVTFLDKHNPEQFEILGITDRGNEWGLKTKEYKKMEVENPGDLNRRAVIKTDKTYKAMYARLLIRRKI